MVKVVKPSPKPQKASVVRKRPAAPAPQGHQSVPATTPATLDGSAEKPDWYGEANATVEVQTDMPLLIVVPVQFFP